MSLPLLLLSDLSSLSTQAAPWLAMVYSGAVATAFASVIIIIVVRRTGASFLSQINFIIPLIGVAISILFLGEVLPSNGFMALAIILIGVAIARRRPKRTIISINKGS